MRINQGRIGRRGLEKVWIMRFVAVCVSFGMVLLFARDAFPDQLAADIVMELSEPTIVCGQNQPMTIRIRNTSDSDLQLEGFNVGHDIPYVMVRQEGDSWRKLHRGNVSESDRRGRGVDLRKGEEKVFRAFMFSSLSVMLPEAFHEPGDYQLRATMPIMAMDPISGGRQEVIWSTRRIELHVVAPEGRVRDAYESLRAGLRELQQDAIKKLEAGESLSFDDKVDFYDCFLREFGATPYATEVRAYLGEGIARLIDNTDGRNLPDDRRSVLAAMGVKLLEEMADRGGFYAQRALPRLADMYVDVPEVRDWDKAFAVLERWVDLEPDNAKAVRYRDQMRAELRSPMRIAK